MIEANQPLFRSPFWPIFGIISCVNYIRTLNVVLSCDRHSAKRCHSAAQQNNRPGPPSSMAPAVPLTTAQRSLSPSAARAKTSLLPLWTSVSVSHGCPLQSLRIRQFLYTCLCLESALRQWAIIQRRFSHNTKNQMIKQQTRWKGLFMRTQSGKGNWFWNKFTLKVLKSVTDRGTLCSEWACIGNTCNSEGFIVFVVVLLWKH